MLFCFRFGVKRVVIPVPSPPQAAGCGSHCLLAPRVAAVTPWRGKRLGTCPRCVRWEQPFRWAQVENRRARGGGVAFSPLPRVEGREEKNRCRRDCAGG